MKNAEYDLKIKVISDTVIDNIESIAHATLQYCTVIKKKRGEQVKYYTSVG